MGNGKKLLLLLLVLLLCCSAWFFIAKHNAETEEPETTEAQSESIDLSAGEAGLFTQLQWQCGARELSFSRATGIWQCTSEKDFPLNSQSGLFSKMLQALSTLSASRDLGTVSDLSIYGLTEPQNVIQAVLSDGTAVEYRIGSVNSVTGDYYLMRSDDDHIYVIDSTLPDAFSYGLFDLVQKDEIPDLSDATVCVVGGTTYQRTTQEDGTGVWCTAAGTPVEQDRSTALTNGLTALDWAACIDYHVDSDEFGEYGLRRGTVITVTCPDAEGTDQTYSLILGDAYDENYTFAAPADSTLAYTIPTTVADALRLQ